MKKALLMSIFLMLAAVPMPTMAADADRPADTQTGKDEQKQGERLEKAKEPESKSDWKINVWPVQPPDEIKSLPQMKDENKHTPPDRP